MRNAPKLVGWVGGKFGYWLSCSLCFPAKCMLLAIGCRFFVPKWVWLAYPRCGRGFRAVALCLAKLEPFYWPSDSSSTVIGPIKVANQVTNAHTHTLAHTLTHTYAHKHKHTYTHSPIHTHIHSLTHIHTHHSYTCTHAHTPPTHAHSLTTLTHTHSLTHAHKHSHKHSPSHTHTHSHTHALSLSHTHTHTHTGSQVLRVPLPTDTAAETIRL